MSETKTTWTVTSTATVVEVISFDDPVDAADAQTAYESGEFDDHVSQTVTLSAVGRTYE